MWAYYNVRFLQTRAKAFIGQPITDIYKCKAQRGSYAFFRADNKTLAAATVVQWFGNVKFVIKMKEILTNDQLSFYYVDTHTFNKAATSRVIITIGCPSNVKDFLLVKNGVLNKIFEIRNNKFYYATRYIHQSGTSYKHTVHLILDCNKLDTQDLYSKSLKMAVDHSKANTRVGGAHGRFQNGNCLIYNSVGHECPSPFYQKQTLKKMQLAGIQLDDSNEVYHKIDKF